MADRPVWKATNLRKVVSMIREADAQALRAAALNDIGRHAEALEVLDPALVGSPDHVELLVQAAIALDATGRAKEAAVVCREAVRLSPQDVRGFRMLANILVRAGEVDAAHQAASTALTLSPSDPFSLLALSHVEIARGRREAAVEAAERALALAPGLDTAHLQLATALTTGRRRPSARTLRRAEQHVREVLRDHPDDPEVLAELARVRALRRSRLTTLPTRGRPAARESDGTPYAAQHRSVAVPPPEPEPPPEPAPKAPAAAVAPLTGERPPEPAEQVEPAESVEPEPATVAEPRAARDRVGAGLLLVAHALALVGLWVLLRLPGAPERGPLTLAVAALLVAGVLAGAALGRRSHGLLADALVLLDGAALLVATLLTAPVGRDALVLGLPMIAGILTAMAGLRPRARRRPGPLA